MTGSALNLALKLVIRHDELENVSHGVLRDALAEEVSGTQILLPWIGLKKLACKHVKHGLVCALTYDIPLYYIYPFA